MNITSDFEQNIRSLFQQELEKYFSRHSIVKPDFFTVEDVAKYLNISTSTVRKWMDEGKINYIKLPGKGIRFKREWVDGWIDKRTVKAKFKYWE